MKRIIDISWPISQRATEYKDKGSIHFEQLKQFEKDLVRDSTITCNSHTGTHVDAPAHFMADGATIENVPLESINGPCKVIDLTDVPEAIMGQDLTAHDITEGDIILFKTTNSALASHGSFHPHFVYLHESGAHYLADKKIKAVGIDYLGIERNQPTHPTHITLMDAGVTIIEGLRLQSVDPGTYTLMCLPLAVEGLEAAPARAVLLV